MGVDHKCTTEIGAKLSFHTYRNCHLRIEYPANVNNCEVVISLSSLSAVGAISASPVLQHSFPSQQGDG